VSSSQKPFKVSKLRLTKPQRIAIVIDVLQKHFPSPSVPLDHTSPYSFLIAVLLSAQCTDARVNIVTPNLFALADTPEKMVLLTPETIESVIRPCGLGKVKSHAIWNLSKRLIDTFNSTVPSRLEDLETLPGVGHKTASVVVSQIFHTPAFPVDTHIHRCAKRWGLSSGKNVIQTERDLKKCFPKDLWNTLHLQIIYFARKFCPARGHNLEECPICQKLNLL